MNTTMVSQFPSQSAMGGRTTVFSNRPCILCVDDDTVGLEVRGHVLRRQGYSVVLVNRPELVDTHDLSAYQLAIVDFDMPGLNGVELLTHLRSHGATFPIVLLSGSMDILPPDKRALFSACIEKGDPVHRLLHTVAACLPPEEEPANPVRWHGRWGLAATGEANQPQNVAWQFSQQ
ncbi:MAG: response regulator [Acidobacteriaceae bacterium]